MGYSCHSLSSHYRITAIGHKGGEAPHSMSSYLSCCSLTSLLKDTHLGIIRDWVTKTWSLTLALINKYLDPFFLILPSMSGMSECIMCSQDGMHGYFPSLGGSWMSKLLQWCHCPAGNCCCCLHIPSTTHVGDISFFCSDACHIVFWPKLGKGGWERLG